MNRAFLDTNMPLAITGQDEFNEDVIFPGATIAFKDKETKVSPLLPSTNLSTMFASMNKVESSMEESSLSDLSAGQDPEGGQTATATAIANANAKTMLQGIGKTLAQSMVQYGGLMSDIFITHLTIPMIDELAGEGSKLKYRTFTLPKKMVGGKEVSKVLKFDDSLLGMNMTDMQKTEKEMKMLETIGYPNHKSHLYLINPELFARYKYLTYIEPQTMFPQNQEFMEAKAKDLYTMLRQDPLVSAETIVKDLLYASYGAEAEDRFAKPQAQGIIEGQTGESGMKPPMKPAEQIVKAGSISSGV
jgi:hypothetical protein